MSAIAEGALILAQDSAATDLGSAIFGLLFAWVFAGVILIDGSSHRPGVKLLVVVFAPLLIVAMVVVPVCWGVRDLISMIGEMVVPSHE